MTRASTTLVDRGGTGPEDLVLVRRALRGEPAAVEALLGRLACVVPFVFRLNRTVGYGLATDSLEDVVQQVYATVWPRLRAFQGASALESWVFGFCRNCLRAEARRRAQQHRAPDAGLEEHLPAAAGPEQAIATAERIDALRAEIDRLEPDEREAVVLRHIEGMSFEQIARRLSLPASTVKDRCYRAMSKMRTRLEYRDVRA
jgi:RNA polymerase sigma-70 factor (ECF subfamily)